MAPYLHNIWAQLGRISAATERSFTGRREYVTIDGETAAEVTHPGWRKTINFWTWIASGVLATNVILLIWAEARPRPVLATASRDSASDDTITLFQGDCHQASSIKTWTHLAINVLSTLLLTASSNCMQCLNAPTREEVDTAHRKGQHIDIGLLSVSNLARISSKRSILWCLLAISSVPLHFFYNSVIFSSLAVDNVTAFAVAKDFTTAPALNVTGMRINAAWNSDDADAIRAATALLPANKNPASKRLDTESCIQAFSAITVSGYRSVALVTSVHDPSQVLGQVDSGEATVGNRQSWSCYDASHEYTSVYDFLLACPDTIYVQDVGAPTALGHYLLPAGWTFDECIVETTPDLCRIQISPGLMGWVVFANVVKVTIMLSTVRFLDFEPIVTMGDAVRSFLSRPDTVTTGSGPRSHRELGGRRKRLPLCSVDRERRWKSERMRWSTAVSAARWIITIGICLSIEIAAVMLLMSGFVSLRNSDGTFDRSKQSGFGAIDPTFSKPLSSLNSTVLSVLVSNSPQVLISMAYVLYYTLVSSMISASHLADFSVRRRALRVSPPRHGSQRSTYWLTLPLRFSVFLLVAMTLLHWMVSQAIFNLRIDWVLRSGDVVYGFMNSIGWSPIAVVTAVVWGLVITLFPIFLGFFRLPNGVPLVGYNSLAIAASCHPDPIELPDASEKPLMYGALPTLGVGGRRRVGFSAHHVEPLADGEVYESTRCIRKILMPSMTTCECDMNREDTGYSNDAGSAQKSTRNPGLSDVGSRELSKALLRRSVDISERVSIDMADQEAYRESIPLQELPLDRKKSDQYKY